jgi:hypothetical protein
LYLSPRLHCAAGLHKNEHEAVAVVAAVDELSDHIFLPAQNLAVVDIVLLTYANNSADQRANRMEIVVTSDKFSSPFSLPTHAPPTSPTDRFS